MPLAVAIRGGVLAVALGASVPLAVGGCTPDTEDARGRATPDAAEAPGTGLGPGQFVRIAPGTFVMGSSTGAEDERPAHTVTLTRPFLLQRTEVTQGQWAAVMGSNPSAHASCGARCPVESVSWHDIRRFLARLNARDPGKGYRLPTEAEWEYAARGGTTGDFGGSGVADEMAWHGATSGRVSHPVAERRPNAWGLFDMHGNVGEWVADWHAPYDRAAATDPVGPVVPTAVLREEDTLAAPGAEYGPAWGPVVRGGSFADEAWEARSARRGTLAPDYRSIYIGFRLARAP